MQQYYSGGPSSRRNRHSARNGRNNQASSSYLAEDNGGYLGSSAYGLPQSTRRNMLSNYQASEDLSGHYDPRQQLRQHSNQFNPRNSNNASLSRGYQNARETNTGRSNYEFDEFDQEDGFTNLAHPDNRRSTQQQQQGSVQQSGYSNRNYRIQSGNRGNNLHFNEADQTGAHRQSQQSIAEICQDPSLFWNQGGREQSGISNIQSAIQSNRIQDPQFSYSNERGSHYDQRNQSNMRDLEKIKASPYYIDANLIMKNTCFSQISFQLFFLILIAHVIWGISYLYDFCFLWFVDCISIYMTFRRLKLNQSFQAIGTVKKTSFLQNLLEYIEIMYSVLFKVFLLIHMGTKSFNFFIIPVILMSYIILRSVYSIHLKIKQNISIMSDIFVWGFKLFLSIQILLVSLKYEDMIHWKWRDVFWAYWVFFSIMVGINIGFIIILFSKCYSKCSDDDVESYELKGLFWMFMISNALTVNTTIYITSLINYFDENNREDVLFGFQYGSVFVVFMILYSLLSHKGINLFLYRITKEEEAMSEEEGGRENRQEITDNLRQNGTMANQSQTQGAGGQINGQTNQQEDSRIQQQQDIPMDLLHLEGQRKVKEKKFLRFAITEKISEFPLFFEKLSSTYFKSFSSVPKTVSTNSMRKNSIEVSQHTQSSSNNNKQPKQDLRAKLALVPAIKSSSFMNPRDGDNQRQKHLMDMSCEIDKKGVQTSKRATNRERSEAYWSAVHRSSLSFEEDTRLRGMAQETEEKYLQLLQSVRNVEFQRKIYQENLVKEQGESGTALVNQSACQPMTDRLCDEELIIDHALIVQESKRQKLDLDQGSKENNKVQRNPTDPNRLNSSNLAANSPNQIIKSFTCEKENKQIALEQFENSVSNSCVVCFDRCADTVYMPCGHGGICYECGIDILKKTGECYLCRMVILEVFQVDLKSKEGKNFKVIAVTQILEDNSVFADGTQPTYQAEQIFERNLGINRHIHPEIFSNNANFGTNVIDGRDHAMDLHESDIRPQIFEPNVNPTSVAQLSPRATFPSPRQRFFLPRGTEQNSYPTEIEQQKRQTNPIESPNTIIRLESPKSQIQQIQQNQNQLNNIPVTTTTSPKFIFYPDSGDSQIQIRDRKSPKNIRGSYPQESSDSIAVPVVQLANIGAPVDRKKEINQGNILADDRSGPSSNALIRLESDEDQESKLVE